MRKVLIANSGLMLLIAISLFTYPEQAWKVVSTLGLQDFWMIGAVLMVTALIGFLLLGWKWKSLPEGMLDNLSVACFQAFTIGTPLLYEMTSAQRWAYSTGGMLFIGGIISLFYFWIMSPTKEREPSR